MNNKRTGQPAKIQPLDGAPMDGLPPRTIRGRSSVDWMADPKNPFFARAVANRYWAHFFGRGIVDPLDDMRVTNPPTNPELLDALAKELVDSKFSLKHLIKVIVKSRTYQLTSAAQRVQQARQAEPTPASTRGAWRPRCSTTRSARSRATPAQFGGLPTDKHAPNRAIMLPDEAFPSYFLDVFGRPQRISACECERVSEANLAQALHLLNSQEIQDKLARADGRADRLGQATRGPMPRRSRSCSCGHSRRPPSTEHLQVALDHINRHAMNKKQAYENILWALLNTKEFVFNQ